MPQVSLSARRSTRAAPPPPLAYAPQPVALGPVAQAHDEAGNQAIQAALAGIGDPRLAERLARAVAGVSARDAADASKRPTPSVNALAGALGADRFFGAA